MPTDTSYIDTSFTLCDEHTVKKLLQDSPELLPNYPEEKAVNRGIDLAYGKEQISASVTSGILQGKSIPDIANDLQNRIETMNRNSAIRVARTACTEAENAGRLDSYIEAQGMGIDLQKQWMATSDSRTRPTHAEADGQIVDIDKPFEVGSDELMFPGDPSGSPAEIYNCRCTMVSVLKDLPQIESQAEEPEQEEVVEDCDTIKDAKASGITYKEVHDLKTPLAEKEIISRLGGLDDTTGSCASLSFAYMGNKCGYDVLDYRGGISRDFFSRKLRMKELLALDGVKGEYTYVPNEQKGTMELLNRNTEVGKEYCLATGGHRAIVRKTETGGYEYLELQGTPEKNGWYTLNEYSLKHRFSATKSRSSGGYKMESPISIVDIDSLKGNKDFKQILGYLNTAEGDQKKGVFSGVK